MDGYPTNPNGGMSPFNPYDPFNPYNPPPEFGVTGYMGPQYGAFGMQAQQPPTLPGISSAYQSSQLPLNFINQLNSLPGYRAQADYTAIARPGYQEFGPSGQFYQPIYRPSYTDYNTGQRQSMQSPVAIAAGIPALLSAIRGGSGGGQASE